MKQSKPRAFHLLWYSKVCIYNNLEMIHMKINFKKLISRASKMSQEIKAVAAALAPSVQSLDHVVEGENWPRLAVLLPPRMLFCV